ncbi:hypothetical protein EDC01DRAFT_415768 [Geopyxis carbonaria]|nr:hypothetical protein EDC01DRAFT_415768 [Geopyxis carbonaria]
MVCKLLYAPCEIHDRPSVSEHYLARSSLPPIPRPSVLFCIDTVQTRTHPETHRFARYISMVGLGYYTHMSPLQFAISHCGSEQRLRQPAPEHNPHPPRSHRLFRYQQSRHTSAAKPPAPTVLHSTSLAVHLLSTPAPHDPPPRGATVDPHRGCHRHASPRLPDRRRLRVVFSPNCIFATACRATWGARRWDAGPLGVPGRGGAWGADRGSWIVGARGRRGRGWVGVVPNSCTGVGK